MKYTIALSIFLSLQTFSFAQFVLSGTITNSDGDPLIGATISDESSLATAVSAKEGKFEIRLKKGRHSIIVHYLGYKTLIDSVDVNQDVKRNFQMRLNPFVGQEFVVEALRAKSTTPMTFENISSDQLRENNLGQDLPILLNQTVSMVTTSDAGAGIGYTGMRIRGSDATRINVTVNGVPLNDPESHGVFWVNMPDFTSSTQNIQIQRGVGSSSNGAASFGASVNLETTKIDSLPSAEFNNSIGSFNTRKHNAIINSGLINEHFNFEGRLSYISSDGYIDRSASDLRSYYMSGGYYGKKMMLKALTFSGKEITQQAWWGTPESRITGDKEDMLLHAINNGLTESQTQNLLESGRTYNYYQYQNEIDNYSQAHYQLITGFHLSDHLYLNVTGHYTKGKGYFEQYKANDDLSNFGLDYPVFGDDTITNSNVIVRRWLDNDFYGGVYSLQYNKKALSLTWGGSVNQYDGQHYGEVIWSEFALDSQIGDRYYESSSTKVDAANYLKAQVLINRFTLYADAQVRFIDYQSNGVDNDQRAISIDKSYLFFNPKAGVNFEINSKQNLYLSYARASREPVRSDFVDASVGSEPSPEFLNDVEMGWSFNSSKFTFGVNAYAMIYKNQLVLTGELNDVGSSVRTNVPESYRAGIEMHANVQITKRLYWRPNLTLSRNKIESFNEIIYDYTNGFEVVEVAHANTDIAFSPSVIGASELGYRTKNGFEVALLTKYVGKQFLDNTSNQTKMIEDYVVNDVRLSYQLRTKWTKALQMNLLINNILNEVYSSNGYTYSYIYGAAITENFYYPQAGTNWLLGLTVKF